MNKKIAHSLLVAAIIINIVDFIFSLGRHYEGVPFKEAGISGMMTITLVLVFFGAMFLLAPSRDISTEENKEKIFSSDRTIPRRESL